MPLDAWDPWLYHPRSEVGPDRSPAVRRRSLRSRQVLKTLANYIAKGPELKGVQEGILQNILDRNREAVYGKAHGFGSVSSWADYQRLPLMTYDQVDFDGDYWSEPENYTTERVLAFFLTSGSSSAPKRVPVTGSLVRQKAAAFAVFWDGIYSAYPALRDGTFIANFGDSGVVERSARNVVELSETTFWNQRMQGFQRADRWPIPRQLSAIDDAEMRYYGAARLAMQAPLHCMMSLNPSTLVKLCEVIDGRAADLSDGLREGTWGVPELDGWEDLPAKLADRLSANHEAAERLASASARGGPTQLLEVWPDLTLLICWQSELVSPYLDLLRRRTGSVPFRDYITQSSECIMAIPYRDGVSGGLLAYGSHFYEFIPAEEVEAAAPSPHPSWDLEEGGLYEVVVTTGGGLYRYRTSDCVRVGGHENGIPLLSFQHRFGQTSSMTGEKLTEAQIMEGLRRAATEDLRLQKDVVVFPRGGDRPHYGVLLDEEHIPSGSGKPEIVSWLNRFHGALCEVNGEYRAKCGSLRLGLPRALVARAGELEALKNRSRARHVGDDQYKPRVLWRERDVDQRLSIRSEIDADQPD